MSNKTLHLTLKRKWFYMIASGEKMEEYRKIKRYWETRIVGKDFDYIKFVNGYARNDPTITVQCGGVRVGLGRAEWGAPVGKEVFILKLGKIVSCACIPADLAKDINW